MSTTGRKWLVGCGFGCGLILLLLGGVGTCGFFAVKHVVDQAKDVEAGMAAMDSTFGETGAYTPTADGRLDADRLETFLKIREQMEPNNLKMSQLITTLEGHGAGTVLAKIQAGIKFVPAILGFMSSRNMILVDQGMGLGEYQYLYGLSYYGLLAKDPADGPRFSLINDDSHNGNYTVKGSFSRKDSTSVRKKRSKVIRRFINKTERKIMTNQLVALEADSALSDSLASWRDSLAAEVKLMTSSQQRLPWEDGLPDRISSSLEPFKYRLDQLYHPLTSGLEMGLSNDD